MSVTDDIRQTPCSSNIILSNLKIIFLTNRGRKIELIDATTSWVCKQFDSDRA